MHSAWPVYAMNIRYKRTRDNKGDSDAELKKSVRETIQTYFDSMFESKADKVHRAFHPNARISGDTPQGFLR